MDDFYCLCLYDKDIFTDNYAFSTTIAGVKVLEMVFVKTGDSIDNGRYYFTEGQTMPLM